MQVLITHGHLARSRVLHLSRLQIVAAVLFLAALVMLFSGTVYHFVFMKAAREGWPVVSQVMRLLVRDEIAQRDRFMRENLDVMASKVGELQAKLVKLESMGDRVSGLAGVRPDELKPLQRVRNGGKGGPYVPLSSASLPQLTQALQGLDEAADQSIDLFKLIESRLLESRLQALMVPNTAPVRVSVGSAPASPSARSLARPKSSSFTQPGRSASRATNTFAGLMSRCTMPRAWATARA